jgi:uncharacterized membrane protein HdeD (DUF308 family)
LRPTGSSTSRETRHEHTIGLDPAASREVKRHWGWFVALGVALMVLGVIALGVVGFVTLASVLFFGWLLVIGGIMQVVQAGRARARRSATPEEG